MAHVHTVRAGDCIGSIAFAHGLLPITVWSHPRNADLRRARKSMNILLDGDEVFVPDRREKRVSCAIDEQHTFRRYAVPDRLRVRFVDADERPRAGVPYEIEIAGAKRTGALDAAGILDVPVPPDAHRATLRLGTGAQEELYEIALGHLDPLTELSGVRTRLTSLGYPCMDEPGDIGEHTRRALRCFQEDQKLDPTGALDERTLHALERVYGS